MFEHILANFATHITLDAADTDKVTAAFQYKVVSKNGSLLEAGEVCRNIYFVNRGCLRIFNRDKNGDEHNIMFCPENWWGNDMTSFTGQSPAYYYISALEITEVVYISHKALEQLYIDVPKLERFFRILVQNGFSLFQRRINTNLSKTAQERYVLFQQLYPRLEQRISQKHIASYLGITPVFLSMIRKRNK
ncbi:CRP-like cAMP-binding protein [Mucilaginibacter sp. UYP25]|uniref:Crp/Fnr family transcriptional regulator n=1 Tax=unclassified Mucilaginibacter TaxID=2617802 RepID=UPI0033952E56